MGRDRIRIVGEPGVPVSRLVRRRRSTWHRLLVLLDAQTAEMDGLLSELVGLPPERLRACLAASTDMPLVVRWRLAVVAECVTPRDSRAGRLARILRGELNATAAFLQRGAIRDQPVPIRLYVEFDRDQAAG